MAERDQDGEGQTAVRGDWVAEQLGDRWQTSGDGIYRLVEAKEADLLDDLEPSGSEPHRGGDRPARRGSRLTR